MWVPGFESVSELLYLGRYQLPLECSCHDMVLSLFSITVFLSVINVVCLNLHTAIEQRDLRGLY